MTLSHGKTWVNGLTGNSSLVRSDVWITNGLKDLDLNSVAVAIRAGFLLFLLAHGSFHLHIKIDP